MKKDEKKLLMDSAEERVVIEENKQLLLESLVKQADALNCPFCFTQSNMR